MALPKPATVRKFLVALAGAAVALVSAGVLPDNIAKWVAAGIAVLSAAGVYTVPNAGPTPKTMTFGRGVQVGPVDPPPSAPLHP